MRIAWLTPFSVHSAIARFSRAVVPELAQAAEVEVCCFDHEEIRQTSVPVRRYSSAEAFIEQMEDRFDLVVHNLGNYLPYHREIYRVSRMVPGICILHDFVMHHFFAAYCLEHLRSAKAYSLLMEGLYGSEGRVLHDARIWESEDVVRFPMFEEAIRGARGVVVHSEFFRRRLAAVFSGPVRRIPLAYEVQPDVSTQTRAKLGIAGHAIVIVTVGHVNTNKRIEDVIRALGGIGDIGRPLTYVIVGSCPAAYGQQLAETAQRHGVGECVRLVGNVPDDVLRSYLVCADICVNLRSPAFEGASASVIEEMLIGKPVIVNDVGFFSELPADCVARISLARKGELANELKRLAGDPDLRAQLGARARQFAEREHSAGRYAEEILEFAWEVRGASPLLGLADRIAVELNRMGVTEGAQIVGTAAGNLHSLFCAPTTELPLWRV